jgi:hypothetical protein
MSQYHTLAVPQDQAKPAPAAPSAPSPIDPNLLRQISGGTTDTCAPKNNW